MTPNFANADAAKPPVIAAGAYDLAIFDLDGVVTKTARLHAAAWKRLFDDYLRRREGPGFRPFDIDTDYLTHVDGKPRDDGVRGFLESRGIALPDGSPDDPPMAETVRGLGNAKNGYFREALHSQGVDVYEPAVRLIQALRAEGFTIAVVTSSRNCEAVVNAAHLAELFDLRVDGTDIDHLGLAGKPAPDGFLEAARRAEAEPARAVVVEDALSGVAAGRAGGFGLVIGVDQAGQREALLRHGADVVVSDLSTVAVAALPSALTCLPAIAERLRGRRLGVFLDYDGTLTPIVPRPQDAVLSAAMHDTLRRLAECCTVAVVTGRSLEVVKDFVGLEGLTYAAEHGFDIAEAGGRRAHPQGIESYLPTLAQAEAMLRTRLRGLEGALIERKRYSVAAHYRLVAREAVPVVSAAVDAVLAAHPSLRRLDGKRVYELQARLEWDKGKAVLWLLKDFGLTCEDVIYVGDDKTDEDAFRAIRGRGIGVHVRDWPQRTAAAYWLADPGEVMLFLRRLIELVADAAR
jgi:alpha,alpha-trehalase